MRFFPLHFGLILTVCSCAAGTPSATLQQDATTTAQALGPTYDNPVISENFPDPSVVAGDGGFYAYATNGAGGNVPTKFSNDLVRWEARPDAMPKLPSWAGSGATWAPDVTPLASGGYVMYFSARGLQEGVQCVGVATSQSAAGPFVSSSSSPLICPVNEGGAIDASGFIDVDGSRYVVWKNDGNSRGLACHLQLQPVSNDGQRVTGPATVLLTNDKGWEGAVIEAPILHRHNNIYYLIYSANNYANGSYAIGYATANNITGPYTKGPGPWISSNNAHGPVIGPGGASFITASPSLHYLVYHTWAPNMSGRPMSLMRITFADEAPQATSSYGVSTVDLN